MTEGRKRERGTVAAGKKRRKEIRSQREREKERERGRRKQSFSGRNATHRKR
jgi:hypothetical protein